MSAFAVGAYGTPSVSTPATRASGNNWVLRPTQPCLLESFTTVVFDAGLGTRHACPTFRPRPSAYRLCRQTKLQMLKCTASSAAQPLHSAHPSPVHKVAAAVLSFWQHSLRTLASLLQLRPGQPDQHQASNQASSVTQCFPASKQHCPQLS